MSASSAGSSRERIAAAKEPPPSPSWKLHLAMAKIWNAIPPDQTGGTDSPIRSSMCVTESLR